MCKDHKINFVDLIDFFIKSRVLLVKEKIWNYYKQIEDVEQEKIINLKDIMNYLTMDLNAVFYINKIN